MLTAKFSTKRVLGVVLATGLALTGTVAVAANSNAATIPAVKLSPITGSTGGATVVTVTGKGFQNAAGVSQVGKVWFSTATCAPLASGWTNPVVTPSVISDTKIVVTTPALPLTSSPKPTDFNLCVQNGTLTTSGTILGTGKFTSYIAPLINTTLGGTNGLTAASGASYGGDTLTITGENFTAKTTAKVGGVALTGVKVVLGALTSQVADSGDDTITGIVPAGTVGAKAVVVTTEGGSVTSGGAGATSFTYLDAIKVSPAFGNGTAGNVITLTGVGFSARSFVNTPAVNKAVIQVAKATTNTVSGATLAAYTTASTGLLCTNIQVESDTSLSCQLPDLTTAAKAGPYTAQIVDIGAANTSAVTAVSRGATYTVSAF